MIEKTISVSKINLLGFLIFLVLASLVIFFYDLYIGIDVKDILDETSQIIYFIVLFFVPIFFHELIHAAVFALFAKNKWSSVKIGVLLKHITPYAHCSESLRKIEYAFSLVAPGIVLGIMPICYAFLYSNITSLIYGLIMLSTAMGDFIILAMVLCVPKGKKVLDHKDKVGFWIV